MKNLYILDHGKAKQVSLDEFVNYSKAFIESKGLKFDPIRTSSCLTVMEAIRKAGVGSPWDDGEGNILVPEPEAQAYYDAVECVYKAHIQLYNEATGRVKTVTEMEQEALENSLETIQIIRHEEVEEQKGRLRAIVDRNFEILPTGGLVMKEGAPLTMEDSLTTIGALLQQGNIAEDVREASTLGLADVLGPVEAKFGEKLDYTQIMDATNKSLGTVRQARMLAQHFPPRKRAEIDPEVKLTASHYIGVCRKGLRPEDKDALLKFAVRRSSTKESVGSTKLLKLAATLEKIPEADRTEVIGKADTETETTDGAVTLLRHYMQLTGVETESRRRWLYIKYAEYNDDLEEEDVLPWQKTSNEYSRDLANKADLVIRLTDITVMAGPDTFDKIDHTYISPEILEPDPQVPTV